MREKIIHVYCDPFFLPSLHSKSLLLFLFCCGQNQKSCSMSFLRLSLLWNHKKRLPTTGYFLPNLFDLFDPFDLPLLTQHLWNSTCWLPWLCSALGTVALSVLFATQLNLSTCTCCHLSVMNELMNAVLLQTMLIFDSICICIHVLIKSLIILLTVFIFIIFAFFVPVCIY